MRLAVQILVILVLGFFLVVFLPWWSVAVAAFAGGLLLNSRSNFLGGFIAIGALWIFKAMITEWTTDSDLADRVARIFMLHDKYILLVVTFVIIGLVGGFASMAGGALRKNT